MLNQLDKRYFFTTYFFFPLYSGFYTNIFLIFHKKCAESVGLPWPVVTECYYSGVGAMLQLEAEKATKAIAYPNQQLRFVPTIVYNHVNYKKNILFKQHFFIFLLIFFLRYSINWSKIAHCANFDKFYAKNYKEY